MTFLGRFEGKYRNIKFRGHPTSGSRVVPRGQTDRHDPAVTFRNIANAPKSFKIKLHQTLSDAVGLISLPATDKSYYVTFCNNNFHDHLKEVSGITRVIDDRPPTCIAQTLQADN